MTSLSLSVADVAIAIAGLRLLERHDPDAADAGAEALRVEVLPAIALGGADDPRAVAEAVLVTVGLKIERD